MAKNCYFPLINFLYCFHVICLFVVDMEPEERKCYKDWGRELQQMRYFWKMFQVSLVGFSDAHATVTGPDLSFQTGYFFNVPSWQLGLMVIPGASFSVHSPHSSMDVTDSSLSASAAIDLLCWESKQWCTYKYFYGA